MLMAVTYSAATLSPNMYAVMGIWLLSAVETNSVTRHNPCGAKSGRALPFEQQTPRENDTVGTNTLETGER